MIDDDIIIANARPLDAEHLKRAYDAARRARDAFAMLDRRFVRADDRWPNGGWTWRPTPRIVVQSELVRTSNVRILGIRSRSRRSELLIPEPDGASRFPEWSSDMQGRGQAARAFEHASSACNVLEIALVRGTTPIGTARAMLVSSCLDHGMRSKDPARTEQSFTARGPWTSPHRRTRPIDREQWITAGDASHWKDVRSAVTIDLHSDAAILGTLSSGAFPGDPDPIETLRIHSDARGSRT